MLVRLGLRALLKVFAGLWYFFRTIELVGHLPAAGLVSAIRWGRAELRRREPCEPMVTRQ